LAEAGAIRILPARSLHDIMQQMADTDFVVATRYRNVVCALRAGKPTISIGYAEKDDALLREVGLAEFCQHIERLDLDLLEAQTARLTSGRAAFERKLRDISDAVPDPHQGAGGSARRDDLQLHSLAGGRDASAIRHPGS
jgi:polysaccharide pyruvyl transferase WcaK-like protein